MPLRVGENADPDRGKYLTISELYKTVIWHSLWPQVFLQKRPSLLWASEAYPYASAERATAGIVCEWLIDGW